MPRSSLLCVATVVVIGCGQAARALAQGDSPSHSAIITFKSSATSPQAPAHLQWSARDSHLAAQYQLWSQYEFQWAVTSHPNGWSMPFLDRRDDSEQDFDDDGYHGRGHTFAISATHSGNYTVSLRMIGPAGDVSTDSDTVTVGTRNIADRVQCANAGALETALGNLADHDRIILTSNGPYVLDDVDATFEWAASNVVLEAGSGVSPVIELSGDATTFWRFPSGEDRLLISGITFSPQDAGTKNFMNYSGAYLGLIDCHFGGSISGDYWAAIVLPDNAGSASYTPDNHLSYGCSYDVIDSYYMIATGGASAAADVVDTFFIDCEFGESLGESCLRFNGRFEGAAVNYSDFLEFNSADTSLKDAIRFQDTDWGYAFGCYCQGRVQTGRIGTGEPDSNHIRVEACYLRGGGITDAGDATLACEIEHYSYDITVCNNLILEALNPDEYAGWYIGVQPSEVTGALIAHNTWIDEDDHIGGQMSIDLDKSGAPEMAFRNNIVRVVDNFSRNIIGVGGSVTTSDVYYDGNVYPAEHNDDPTPYHVGSTQYALGNESSGWNSLSFVGSDVEVDVDLNVDYSPTNTTGLTRSRLLGVYHDFWGNARSSTTVAGAVE